MLTDEHKGHEIISAEDALDQCKLHLQNLLENISFRVEQLQESKQGQTKETNKLKSLQMDELNRIDKLKEAVKLGMDDEIERDSILREQGQEQTNIYLNQLEELKKSIISTLKEKKTPVQMLCAREQYLSEGKKVFFI